MKSRAVGAILLVVGVAVLAGAAYAYDAIVTRPLSWPRAEAVVVSSRVVNPRRPTEHRPEIVFELRDGHGLRRVTTVASWSSSSYDMVRAYVDGYPAGSLMHVAVNPAKPDDVRYELGPTATNLILPGVLGGMGLLFAGVGVATTLWRGKAAGPAQASPTLRWVAGLFAAIGITTGAMGGWLWSRGTALDWPEVDATVVDGTARYVSSTTGSPSRSFYDIQVTFVYEVDGVRVTSRTTSGAASRSRPDAVARLQAYPPGSRHRIRHRPGDPNVIRFEVRTFKERMLPLGLLLMGVLFAGSAVMLRRAARLPRAVDSRARDSACITAGARRS